MILIIGMLPNFKADFFVNNKDVNINRLQGNQSKSIIFIFNR